MSGWIKEVIKDKQLHLEFSISATTRPPRAGELNGRDYYFMSVDDFKKKISNHEFAEYQEVYPGRFYGTLKSEIQRIMADGDNVILDEEIEKRVSKAEYELTFAHKFDHIVVNDSLPDAIGNVRRVIQDFIG